MATRSLAKRSELGRKAESLAAIRLEEAGMRVVVRNWRRSEGELDLVALDPEGVLVFCEVRSRTGEASGDPLETVDARKRARVIRAARLYLAEEPALSGVTGYRFDVVAVVFDEHGHPARVVHVPSAFETTT